MGRLKDKRILITGSASGIGRAAARLFAKEGDVLTLCDRDRVTTLHLPMNSTRQAAKHKL